ncbi:MAG TPA: endonuclease domain-containing protein [Candidatus Nitrosotalea sp.]|nr:endonuclease domain-containing protein [Candidatus Nitrosotalea sp.]
MLERAQQLRMTANQSEQRVWSIVKAKRLAGLKFRRQHVIGNYIADFVCLPARLVIEVDGDTHGSDAAQLRDAKRTEEVERAGYRVIRFWNDDVLNDTDDGVAETILAELMTSALPPAEKERLKSYIYAPLPDPLP